VSHFQFPILSSDKTLNYPPMPLISQLFFVRPFLSYPNDFSGFVSFFLVHSPTPSPLSRRRRTPQAAAAAHTDRLRCKRAYSSISSIHRWLTHAVPSLVGRGSPGSAVASARATSITSAAAAMARPRGIDSWFPVAASCDASMQCRLHRDPGKWERASPLSTEAATGTKLPPKMGSSADRGGSLVSRCAQHAA
jgi:hypothetical protein